MRTESVLTPSGNGVPAGGGNRRHLLVKSRGIAPPGYKLAIRRRRIEYHTLRVEVRLLATPHPEDKDGLGTSLDWKCAGAHDQPEACNFVVESNVQQTTAVQGGQARQDQEILACKTRQEGEY